jgi:hypothetical protein
MVEIWTLERIADELGEDVAARAARLAVRHVDDGEPYLTDDELQRIYADLLIENRD